MSSQIHSFKYWYVTLLCFIIVYALSYKPANGQSLEAHEKLFAKYALSEQTPFSKHHDYFIVIIPRVAFYHKKDMMLMRALSDMVGIYYIPDQAGLDFLEANNYEYSPANNIWKLSPQMENKLQALAKQQSSIKLFTLIVKNTDEFIQKIKTTQYSIEVKQIHKESNAMVISCNLSSLIGQLAPNSEVVFIDEYTPATTEVLLNGFYKTINSITGAEYFFPNDNGQGITIGIKEQKMDVADIDLQKRILQSPLASAGSDVHATTISTLAGGAGNSFITGKGVASECTFFSSSYNNLFPDSTALLNQNNVSVQNHSYGTIVQSFYGAEAMSYDMQTAQDRKLMHVFSCGNKGIDTPATGIYAGLGGLANITGNFKMAKNVISVASIDTGGKIAAYSSSGPMYDGRMAPQISALGPNGTSEAAAVVSGACARLQQVYKDLHGQQLPPASLVKSILYCTADDIDKSGIDFRSGFGALNMVHALECLKNNNFDSSALQQGDTWTKTIVIPAQATRLRVVLTWTDTAGTVNSYAALSNNLDLELKEISTGTIYHPWCLNSFPQVDSLNHPPVRRRDTLNTAELISIDDPSPGAYEFTVRAAHIITSARQEFNIAYFWDSVASFRFVAPLQQSDFYLGHEKAEQIKIKWFSGAITTLDTGTLSITMDDGMTWQLLANAIPLSSQNFDWPVPDTNTFVQFRMSTSYGTFLSPQILLGPLTRLNVNYLCTDSFRLSWNPQPLAQSYKVFVLGDSAFLKLLTVQNDTFTVLQRYAHAENVYAVQPVLNNNIKSARSFAVDITNQGVGCMYNSFYGIPVGNVVELTLELQYPQGLDSIAFEKLDPNGNIIKEVLSIFPLSSELKYTVIDESPTQGANYYRAKIWFGDHFVYTETIAIVYQGNQWLFLYPNPCRDGQPVEYTVKESPNDLFLRLFTTEGSLLDEYVINSSGTIMIPKFSKGIYFYTLVNDKGERLQNGKLIIYQ